MISVDSIGASVQSIDYSQDGTNSTYPEWVKKSGRPLEAVLTPSTTSSSCPLSRGRPQKAPTEAPQRGRLARRHDAGGERDEHPDSKARGPKSHVSDEAIPEKVEALRRFINDTSELLEKVVPGISTQICKSFPSRKAKPVPKDFD
jgi:hypothetical protein